MRKKQKAITEAESETQDLPQSLGMMFSRARVQQGLSIEEVSKILKMRVSLIRDVEADDLRGFSHASYARLSLLAYGRFLRIPEDEILPWLPKISDLDVEGHDYLNHISDATTEETRAKMQGRDGELRKRRNTFQIWLWFFGIVLVLLLAWYAILLIRNLERISAKGTVPVLVEEEQVQQEMEISAESQPGPTPPLENLEMPAPAITEPEAETAGDSELDFETSDGEAAAPPTVLPALPVESPVPGDSGQDGVTGGESGSEQPTESDVR